MKDIFLAVVLFALIIFSSESCKRVSTPKPYGYYRIDIPDTAYIQLEHQYISHNMPFSFALSSNATIVEKKKEKGQIWFNIHYDKLNSDIHCSYNAVHNDLKELTDDAINFVYKHVSQATSIPEREFANPNNKVFGVLFILNGNTASPYQFFLTDSTHHFYRGAVYCNCQPNQDSLQPIHQYLEKDVIRLIESFEWR